MDSEHSNRKDSLGKIIPKVEFTQKMQKFIDAPYSLGDKSKGWDCLTMLKQFYDDMGKEFPAFPKGWTWENYADKWNRGEGKKEFKKALLAAGTEIDPTEIMHGDLLVFEGNQMAFGGIYLGSGHILMMFDIGCKVLPYAVMKRFLISARRI